MHLLVTCLVPKSTGGRQLPAGLRRAAVRLALREPEPGLSEQSASRTHECARSAVGAGCGCSAFVGSPLLSACCAHRGGARLTRTGDVRAPGEHPVLVSKTGRRVVGALPEQVAFQPTDSEDGAAGS